MAPQLVLTGLEERKEYYLVFNNGELVVPCNEAVYNDMHRVLEMKTVREKIEVRDYPEGVETFSASQQVEDLPPPPAAPRHQKQAYMPPTPPESEPEPEPEPDDDDDSDWSGEQDDAEDGVGQL